MVQNVIKELEGSRIMTRQDELNMKLEGSLAYAVRFLERNQICEVGLWQKFVNVFRLQEDSNEGRWLRWRSEFWGKMMRGATMVINYTKNDDMYRIVEASVRDILTTQEENGRISGYKLEQELTSWDLWGRKYVMLGMMYFLEICKDKELEERVISSMRRQADYILERVGEGKLDIRSCSKNWEGMNSCSILEPMVRLYRLTGDERYLRFAEYIISTGFIQSANLIELAYADEVAPHSYPVVKAYEMMSCFEGLLQYYCITGIEKYKTALINFGRRIVEGELSIIGCSGCTHELFDHTSVKQTQTDYKGIVQETCVTVTWMKFAAALLEITGDSVFADCIERSFYNSYLGAMNTHRVPYCDYPKERDVPQVLPFDSYSPLVADRRGRKVGGYGLFADGSFYGCCACIAGAGAGTFSQSVLLKRNNGLVLNFYEKGVIKAQTPSGQSLAVSVDTEYPYDGRIDISINMPNKERFTFDLRIPSWCDKGVIAVNGESESVEKGYHSLNREWNDGDVITVVLSMPVIRILPPEGADNADIFAGYRRGPVVLAADMRITDPEALLDVVCDENGVAAANICTCAEIPESKLCVELTLGDGKRVRLIDYASAGKTWTNDSRCAAWLKRK